ncbi:MAG: DUF58 domain-containing protein [Colwellia sp.]|nr:DUF58 domain-containing protein [Colwellia sp.]
MWLSKKNEQPQQDVTSVLDSIASNGIELTIDELILYQNKTSLINLAARKNQQGQMSGNYLSRSKGRGMEFDEVRHYQSGDDIRAIDWRVTARTGKTHTKLFREEVERPVLVVTDLSHSMLFGSQLLFKSVQAAHLAALVTWHAKGRGDRIGGIVFNQHKHSELKPRSRKEGVLHYLHGLVATHQHTLDIENSKSTASLTNDDAQQQIYKAFEENCARLRKLARPGSLVYLITDGDHVNQESIRHLSHISRHCELVVCLISDPLEHNLPTSKQKMSVTVTDGQSRQQLLIGDPASSVKYHQQAQTYNQHKEAQLRKAGARILHYSACQTLEQQLTEGVASWER